MSFEYNFLSMSNQKILLLLLGTRAAGLDFVQVPAGSNYNCILFCLLFKTTLGILRILNFY